MARPNPFRLSLRYADLNPSLGYPGGSCQVQERVRDRVRSERVQDYLIEKHQNEQKFDRKEEDAVYPDDLSIGKAGFIFPDIVLRSHAQHRMDLRGVTVKDIKEAFYWMNETIGDSRRRGVFDSPLERDLLDSMGRPERGRFDFPNGLRMYLRVLRIKEERKGKKVVPTYKVRVESAMKRGGQNPDPVPEDECPHFRGDVWEGYAKEYEHGFDRLFPKRVAYRYALKIPPVPGVQTVVNDKSQKGLPTDIDREKEVVLPPGSATPRGEERVIGPYSYSGPDSESDIKERTLSIPGEQYGHPTKYDYNTVTRRSMTASSPLISQPAYGESDAALPRGDDEEDDGGEGMEKSAYRRRWQQGRYQRKSRGRTRYKRQQYYRRNKAKIKMRQKRWRQKNKNKPAYKQWNKRRRSMNRRRRVASACMVAYAHRSRMASVLTVPDIAFVVGPEQTLGYVHSISPMSGMVTIELDATNVPQLDSLPVELFMNMAAFLTDKDADAFFNLVDVEVGPLAYEDLDADLVRECARRYDRDPDADDFKSDCFDLTHEYELDAMSADQLDAVTQNIVQGFIEGGFGRSLDDADNPEISELHDPTLFYGEVDVQR